MKIVIAFALMIGGQLGSLCLCDRDLDLIKNNDSKYLLISFCLIIYGLGMHLLIESIV